MTEPEKSEPFKIPKCLNDFTAEEGKALNRVLVVRAERGREDAVKGFKERADRVGRRFTEQDEARIRKSWDGWIAKGCPPVNAKVNRPLHPLPEKMHEELLAGGWTFEGPRKVRMHAGKIEEHPFYWSPTKKIGAFQYGAWRMMKNGNKWGGMDV